MANTNGKEHVSIELKKDGSVVAREDIDNLRPTTANTTTKVSCNVGVTKSIGNYEFVKIDCGFEEYCGSEEKHEVFDSLATQAMDRLTHFIENMDNVKRNLAVRSVLSRSCDDPHVQACARTKWILNEEMKIFFKGDYQTFADALKDYGKITEGQAREAVYHLREGRMDFFDQLIVLLEERRIQGVDHGEEAWQAAETGTGSVEVGEIGDDFQEL